MKNEIDGSYNLSTRRQEILNMLDEANEIRVPDLSDHFGVSVVTIRKDLDFLESLGLLSRTHGGAIKSQRPRSSSHLSDRMKENGEAKKRIGIAAANYVQNGDSIIINVGSTPLYAARAFNNDKNLIVITNALSIFNEVAYHPNVTTFFLGGRFDPELQFTYGSETMEQLSKYSADKLIIGMDGIDAVGGATTYNHLETTVMRAMMEHSKERIVIVDSSKFGKVAFAHLAPLSDFNTIVTDYAEKNAEHYEAIEAMGLKIVFG